MAIKALIMLVMCHYWSLSIKSVDEIIYYQSEDKKSVELMMSVILHISSLGFVAIIYAVGLLQRTLKSTMRRSSELIWQWTNT